MVPFAVALPVWGLWVAGAVFHTVIIVRVWRGDARLEKKLADSTFVFSSDPLRRRGMLRGAPAVTVGVWGIALAGGAALLSSQGLGGHVSFGAIIVGMVVGCGGLLLEQSVIAYNRPRFLVPPRMRGERGVRPQGRRGTGRAR